MAYPPPENISAAALPGARGASEQTSMQDFHSPDNAPNRWFSASLVWDNGSHSIERFALATGELA